MKKVIFYTDKNGNSELFNYLRVLELRNDKNSLINAKKIYSYIENLSKYGVSMGEPMVKHIGNKIWELRPLKHRILFFENTDSYVLLNYFIKSTNKTPIKEIIKARKRMNDYLNRENKKWVVLKMDWIGKM